METKKTFNVNEVNLEDIACTIQEQFYNQFGVTIARNKIRYIIKTYIKIIESEVAAGNKVVIQGHGTYDSYVFTERSGVDPVNREPYHIESHLVPSWRSGKTFRDKVKQASLERKNQQGE